MHIYGYDYDLCDRDYQWKLTDCTHSGKMTVSMFLYDLAIPNICKSQLDVIKITFPGMAFRSTDHDNCADLAVKWSGCEECCWPAGAGGGGVVPSGAPMVW